MRRHAFMWRVHKLLLALCVLLQSFNSLTAQNSSSDGTASEQSSTSTITTETSTSSSVITSEQSSTSTNSIETPTSSSVITKEQTSTSTNSIETPTSSSVITSEQTSTSTNSIETPTSSSVTTSEQTSTSTNSIETPTSSSVTTSEQTSTSTNSIETPTSSSFTTSEQTTTSTNSIETPTSSSVTTSEQTSTSTNSIETPTSSSFTTSEQTTTSTSSIETPTSSSVTTSEQTSTNSIETPTYSSITTSEQTSTSTNSIETPTSSSSTPSEQTSTSTITTETSTSSSVITSEQSSTSTNSIETPTSSSITTSEQPSTSTNSIETPTSSIVTTSEQKPTNSIETPTSSSSTPSEQTSTSTITTETPTSSSVITSEQSSTSTNSIETPTSSSVTTSEQTFISTNSIETPTSSSVTTSEQTSTSTNSIETPTSSSVTTSEQPSTSTNSIETPTSSSVTTSEQTFISTNSIETPTSSSVTTSEQTSTSTNSIETPTSSSVTTSEQTSTSTNSIETPTSSSFTTSEQTTTSTNSVETSTFSSFTTSKQTTTSTNSVETPTSSGVTTSEQPSTSTNSIETPTSSSITTSEQTSTSTNSIETPTSSSVTTSEQTSTSTNSIETPTSSSFTTSEQTSTSTNSIETPTSSSVTTSEQTSTSTNSIETPTSSSITTSEQTSTNSIETPTSSSITTSEQTSTNSIETSATSISTTSRTLGENGHPDAVTTFNISAHTTSPVSLTWSPPQENSSSYSVEQTNGTVSNSTTIPNSSFTVTDLTPGVNYTFTVTAAPVQTSVFTNPDGITSLSISAQNTSSVSLTWKPQGNYSSYRVQWTNENVSNSSTTLSTSYTVTDLTPGVNYTFSVTAVNITSGAPIQISTFTNPDVVTNLIISARSTSTVSLAWNPPKGNYSFYTVQWTDETVSNSTTTPNSPFTVTDLTPGVNYTFNVTAVAADNITSGAPVQISTFTNPNVVTNLSISAHTTSSVSLTWNPPQGNYSFYTVQWTNENVSNSTTTPNSNFTVTDLTPGVNYTFNVTAVAADNRISGAPVQTSAFTNPDIVTGLTASSTNTSVSLNWNKPRGQSSSYTVWWTNGTVSKNDTTQNTSYTVTGLSPGVKYTFNVTAVAADNITSGAPVQISTFTNPDVVTFLNIPARSTSSISLTWSPPHGQSSFYTVWWTNGTVSNSTTTPNSSFTVTNLTPGVNYTFNVTAVAADNITSGATVQTSAFTNPDIVTGLTASSTNTSVSLTWTPPRGQSSSYTVWWTNGTVSKNDTTQNTSYTVTGLSPGVKYTFNVTAVAADNITSGAPVQISRFTNPDVVTNLIISAHNTSSVSLTWNPPQGNYSFYTVWWTNGTVSDSTTTPNSPYTVPNLTPGVKYTFNVTAVAADNITSGAPVQISTFTNPDVVTNLIISAHNTSSVSLTWNPPNGQSSFYTVWWTNGTVSNSTTTPNSPFTFTNLTPGVKYTFNVTAVAADNITSGAPVQTSAFTKPDVIQNLTVTEITTSSLFINWSEPIGQRSFFKVQWTYGNVTSNTTTIQTTYNITNLTAGVNYNVCVSAVAGDSSTEGKSVCLWVYTKPDIVQNLTVSDITTSSVLLSWFEPVGRSSYYRVQYGNISMTLNKTSQNTTVTIPNLTPGVQYTFSICAVAADNSTEGSCGSITAYTKPGVIQNLTVTEITTSSLFINWSEPIGQKSFFKVQWTYGNVTSNTTTIQTSYNITNLTAGVNYNVSVSAVARDNSTEGKSVGLSVYTKPDIVQNLTVSDITTSSVLLSWFEPVGRSSYYRVQYGNISMTLDKTSQNTTVTIPNLTPGVQYTFSICAVAADNSTEGSCGSITAYTKPDVIQNLTVTEITTSSLFINWSEPIGQRSFFKVQWTNGNVTSNTTTIQTTYNITNLTAGVNYNVSVSAVAGDSSTEGKSVCLWVYTKPDVIQNLTVTEITTSSLFINWSKPIGQRSFFKVQWTNDNVTSNTTTIQTTYNVTNLTAGVNYNVSVSAVAGDSSTEGKSVCLWVYTKPDVIQNLTVTEITTSSLFINWSEAIGQRSFFKVQWTYDNVTSNTTTIQTTYNITNLTAGVNYNVSVSAVAGDNSTEGKSVGLSVYTKPDIVQNLTVSDITTSSVLLSWFEPVGRSSYYRVQYGNISMTLDKTSQNTTVTIPNLTPGVQYTFSICAVAADNSTEGSCGSITAYTKPGVIQNLTVTEITTSSLFINWSEPLGQRSFFKVQWTYGNVTSNTTTIQTTYNVTNLTAGVNYNVCISAVAGDSSTEGKSVCLWVYTKPDVIQNLTVTEITTSSLFINWSEPIGQRSFFKVQWTYGNVTSNTTTIQTTYNITNLTAGVNYNVSVSAVAGDNSTEGKSVGLSVYTKPDIVQNLTVSDITTSSVLLSWFEPMGRSSYYRVQYGNISMTLNKTSQNTTVTIPNLTPGVQYTFSICAVAADNSTEGSCGSITAYTKPDVIQNLTVTKITTSSLFINWSEPIGQRSFFKVQWIYGNVTSNTTTIQTTYNITNLTAGVNYYIRVSAVAADNVTEGDVVPLSRYTKPEVITNLTPIEITVSSMLLNWSEPKGARSFFKVLWTNGSSPLNSTTTDTFFNFSLLIPGVYYTFKISAVAADNITEGTSVAFSNYTKPDIIRNLSAINVASSSVFLAWLEPIGNRSFFNIQWATVNVTLGNFTSDTHFNVTSLMPGVNYIFSISAFAADNATQGQSISLSLYTKPEIIRNLNAVQITTSSVFLNWTAPVGNSAFYRMLWMNDSQNWNITTRETSFNITNLTAGSSYTFNVSAVAADNVTEGGVARFSACTDTSPVISCTCEGPNRTAAYLDLKWTEPSGHNQGYNISLNTGFSGGTTSSTNYNISNLQYDMPYTVTITTLGCGQSGMQQFECRTGFTVPPVSPDPVQLSIETTSTSGVVTIKFSQSLLNNSNGLVQAYGVLLSTESNAIPNITDVKNTYDDWKKLKKPYLTVLQQYGNTKSDNIQVTIGNDGYILSGTNYTNPSLEPNKYRVAIVIFTNLHITNGVVDTYYSFASITQFASITINIPKSPDVVGIVLGVLCVIIVILIIAVIVFIKKRRQREKKDTDIPISNVRNKISIPVRVEDYEVYFKKQQADSNCGFAEEYEDLKVIGTAQSKSSALAMENKGKNRYNNVLPYDSSRVKLSTHGSPFDDYINANYIAGYNSRKEYIAAQGPLPATVNEFWRMIWEKHVQTIVMLTRCNEQGRVKCEKYWPTETKMYSNIMVTNVSEIALEDWTISDFTIKNVKTAESREVRHFHFTAWPDHGVPETTEVLINFRHLVREHMDQYSRHSPTVVHCSAGVGRTGTFIALDHLIFQIERDSMVDIFGIVYDMRMHRSLMVQTEDQYVFLNQCAVDIIKSRMGTNVDLIYQNAAAFSVYGNVQQQWR